MNVLLKGPASAVGKNLNLFEPRKLPLRVIMYAQTLVYAYYLYKPGHTQLRSHTWNNTRLFNPLSYAFNLGTLYTLGNYHAIKHGTKHFAALYFGSMALWLILSGKSQPTADQRRNYEYISTAGASTIIGYNVFKNPSLFKVMSPQIAVASLFFYGLFWNDSMAIKGLVTGFSAFLII